MNLLHQLHLLYEEDSHDPFNIYGLAIEYLKQDKLESKKYFDLLLQHHPNYLPTYYHAAALFAELGFATKAIDTYEIGIALATMQANEKALRELNVALQNLRFDLEID